MQNQVVIQIILIVVFVLLGVALVIPVRGGRRLAIRRILLLLITAAGIVAIAVPDLVNSVANLVGVGRGTDLVLYFLVLVFIGNSISNSIQHRKLEREMTQLARMLAIDRAPAPGKNDAQGPENRTGAGQ